MHQELLKEEANIKMIQQLVIGHARFDDKKIGKAAEPNKEES